MSFQPLADATVDPFATASLTGFNADTGLYLDIDPLNSSVLVKTSDTPALYIDKYQNVGINTLAPGAQLDVNSSSGSGIQLTYNGSETNKANITVTSDGKLSIAAGGSEVNVDASTNFNIKSHNGSTSGLMLNNSVVQATATQLNYTTATPGTASVSKALILNSSGSIAGINSLSATTLIGTLGTSSQPNITELSVVDVTGHNGIAGLSLGGVLVTATADKLNYVDTTEGTAAASKALILDSSRNIININNLTATSLTGTLQTAAQPNVTSLGTLTTLDLSGDLTGLTDLSINTTETGSTLVINSATGDCFRMFNDAAAGITKYTDLSVDGFGSLAITASGGNVDITTHDGAEQGLKLGGILISASADQINYLQGTTPGSVTAGKAMVIDSSRNISNINALTATNLTGTLQTASQPNLTSVSVLNVTSHDGGTVGLKLNGQLVTATAEELNYVDTTAGAAEASKALVLDASKDISGINSLSATDLTGTLQTAAQPNVTSVGTLTSITTSGDLTMGTTVLSEAEVAVLDEVVPGTVSASKAVVVDANKDISSFRNLTAINLTGTLQTASQPNVTSVSVLDITSHDGSTLGLKLGGTLVTATAEQINSIFGGGGGTGTFTNLTVSDSLTLANADGSSMGLVLGETLVTSSGIELNYLDGSTPGSATANKALVLDSNKDISGINSLSATDLTGTLQTAAQPNVTSVGTLTSVTTSGDLTMGTTVLSESEVAVLDAVTPGTVSASKAVVVDANKDVSAFRNLTAVNLTGTLQTAYQPNVNTVDVLDVSAHDGATVGLKLGGVLVTATAEDINAAVGVGGVGAYTNLSVSDSLTLSNADGSSMGLVLGETLVTATGNELNYVDTTPGTAEPFKAIVLDASKNIAGINSLSATNLTGTLQTAAQPNITSVGTLTSVTTSGDLTMGTTVLSESEVAVLDGVVAGTVAASKAVVVDANKDISSFRNLTAENLTGTLQTAAQPNVTSVGTLTSLEVAGDINCGGNLTVGGTVISESEIVYLDDAIAGTVSASKAVIVDANKDISSFRNLTATNLTGTLQTASQPNVTSVSTLDVTAHDGSTVGLKLGGTLLTATAADINVAVGADGVGAYTNLSIGDSLTLTNADGSTMGLVLGETLVTSTGAELNYVDTTPGTAQASKALVVDSSTDIVGIHHLSATDLTGTLQTPYQPNVTSVDVLDITAHDGATVGLKLGGILVTATATEINSIFGAGGSDLATFNSVTVNDTLTLANADGSTMGLVLGETLVTTSGAELNYLDGSTPGTATIGKALVVDANKDISGINALTASTLTGTLQTAAQPNITSVGTLTSVTTSGDLTMGSTVLSEAEVAVLDAVTPGTVAASKAVVVDINKDISTFRNLTATNLIGTTVTGTVQTAAQPNITSVGTLTSLDISGDLSCDGNLTVGGTVISEAEILVLDSATAGTAEANKAMVTDVDNSIAGINSLSATTLTGTLQTAAQPNVTSVGELTSLDVAGDINCGGSLTVGGTVISESEIIALDSATPGTAEANKAMITDVDNSIGGINSLTATTLTGTLQTAAQPNIASVTVLDVTGHDGAEAGLALAGTLVTSTATELNYVDTTVGAAQASKAMILDAQKDIDGVHEIGVSILTAETGGFSSVTESVSVSTGSITTLGGVGIAKSLFVGIDAAVGGALSSGGAISTTDVTNATSTSTGSVTTAGGVGIAKSLFVGLDSTLLGALNVTGTTTQTGVVNMNNLTESTTTTNGALVIAGGAGIAKSIVVGIDATIGGNVSINGSTTQSGTYTMDNITDSTSVASGSFVTAGGAGIAKSLFVGGDVANSSTTDSTSPLTGAIVTAGGVGIGKSLFVGEDLTVSGSIHISGGSAQTGVISTTDTTQSTSTATGALIVAGGVGIAKNVYIGENANVEGNAVIAGTTTQSGVVTISNITESTSVEDGALVVAGGVGVAKSLFVGVDATIGGDAAITGSLTQTGSVTVQDVTDATTSTSGSLKTAGGVGIAKSLFVGGSVSVAGSLTQTGAVIVNDTTDSTSTSTGSIKTAGGVGVAKALFVGTTASVAGDFSAGGISTLTGDVIVESVTDSESFDTGSFVTAGGAGIAKALVVGTTAHVVGAFSAGGASTLTGAVSVESVLETESAGTGSIVTAGGVGIAKSLFVGVDATIGGDVSITGATTQTGAFSIVDATDSSSVSTGSFVTAGGVGVGKALYVGGKLASTATTDASSTTTGSITTAGGVGIAKSLYVGTGIYGTLQTASQPNVTSVATLDITEHGVLTQGLSLAGDLVTSSATELNYLDGSIQGSATAGNALVVDISKDISGINSLSAIDLTGTIQTAAQPHIATVDALDITTHDGSTVGLKLGGVLLTATSTQINALFDGSYSTTVVDQTVTNNLTLSGHNGEDAGLILGSTLVTATADELNYLDTTAGTAAGSKALILDSSRNITNINSLTASTLTGTIQTASQPNISSVTVLNITGHDGAEVGLSLGGVLVTSTAAELNYVDTTAGTAEASKALVLDENLDIANINSLTATSLTGTLQTAAQPNITSVGTLTSVTTSGTLTLGATAVTETDIAKITSITNGTAAAGKALVLDSNKDISGINAVSAAVLAIGAPTNSNLPVEVGKTSFTFSGAYAYMNDSNAHGLVEIGMGVAADYSARFDGRILVTGEVECTSDRRMKKNIVDIDLDIAKRFVMESRPIRFNWKSSDDKPELGWVAQEVLKAGFTDLVSVTPYPGLEETCDEDGFVSPADAKLSIATGKVIPLLTMTVKDLYKENEELKARMERLETFIQNNLI